MIPPRHPPFGGVLGNVPGAHSQFVLRGPWQPGSPSVTLVSASPRHLQRSQEVGWRLQLCSLPRRSSKVCFVLFFCVSPAHSSLNQVQDHGKRAADTVASEQPTSSGSFCSVRGFGVRSSGSWTRVCILFMPSQGKAGSQGAPQSCST